MPAWYAGATVRPTIPAPAHVDNVNRFLRVRFDGLADVVDVPLRQFLRFARLRLISLRLGDQRLVIHHVGRVARQHQHVIEGGGGQAHHASADGNAPGVQVQLHGPA